MEAVVEGCVQYIKGISAHEACTKIVDCGEDPDSQADTVIDFGMHFNKDRNSFSVLQVF